jgi:hypothetical protein
MDKSLIDFKYINGLNIILNPMLECKRIQFRFPRRKCRRLRKKYAKNPNNWKMKSKSLLIGGELHVDKLTYEKLKSKWIFE